MGYQRFSPFYIFGKWEKNGKIFLLTCVMIVPSKGGKERSGCATDDENKLSRQVLEELVAIGFARVTDYFFVRDGQILLKEPVAEQAGAVIASMENGTKGIKVKCYDKLKALELLGKHLGLFDKKEASKPAQNNLLQAILEASREEVDICDLPEVQQAAAAGHDVVGAPDTSAP